MNKLLLFSIFISIIGASCTPLRVISEFDQKTNIEDYTSFDLRIDKMVFPVSSVMENHEKLEAAMIVKMEELGFVHTENPDLKLSYFITKEIKTGEVHTGENPDDLDYDFLIEVFTYKEGTLVLDMYSSQTNEIIWHGVLSRTVHEDKRTANNRISRNINALFKRFSQDMKMSTE